MPKITLGIKGLHEILSRDYGIEEPYWEPSSNYLLFTWGEGYNPNYER